VRRRNSQRSPGIVIGFTGDVRVSAIDPAGVVVRFVDAEHVFQVLVESDLEGVNARRGLLCRCPIRGTVVPVDLDLDGAGRIVLDVNGRIDRARERPPGDARGIAFLFEGSEMAGLVAGGRISDLWAVLRGDFVTDVAGRAVDAEFARAELPTGDRPGNNPPNPASKFGVQGGLFESWFRIRRG
jgi:hypothetical protein